MRPINFYSRRCFLFRVVVIVVLLAFVSLSAIPPGHAQMLSLPPAGAVVPLSPGFQPAVLRGIQVDPFKHLEMNFIVDAGDSGLRGGLLEQETKSLVHYFLASLAIPEDDLWVNLSPYEDDRIVPANLGLTDMGRDLLAQDYLLKQVTASLLHPDDQVGREFWKRVYKRAYEEHGTTNVPVNTFNKVWILPDTAHVYEEHDRAIITDARMKVMLEEDYLSKEKNLQDQVQGQQGQMAKLSSDIVREIIVPEIEKEVNEGKNFARVRQIYYSLVLAHWFKTKLRGVLLNKIFSDMSKVEGFKADDPKAVEAIYDQYVESFKKGVCNLLRIDYDTNEKKHVPRKYFSGGVEMKVSTVPDTSASAITVLNKVAKAGALFFAGLLLNFAVSANEAQPATVNLSDNLNIELAEDMNPNNLDGPPNLDPAEGRTYDATGKDFGNNSMPVVPVALMDTIQQKFGKYQSLKTNDVLESARGDAQIEIIGEHPTTIKNSGKDVKVDILYGRMTDNQTGEVTIVFFAQLQNPSKDFNQGHMTYSHSLHALINAAKGDSLFANILRSATGGKTIQQFEAHLDFVLRNDRDAEDHPFMNEEGVDNTRRQSIAAISFLAQSDAIVPVITRVSPLDPLPFKGWEADVKIILDSIPNVEIVEVKSGNTFNVYASGEWRRVSLSRGQDGRNLNNIINKARAFAFDVSRGNIDTWAVSGQKFLDNFSGIQQAAGEALDMAGQTAQDAQAQITRLAQQDSTIFNLLNLIVPNFLDKVDQNARDILENVDKGIIDGQGQAQEAYDQARSDLDANKTVLAYLGFLSTMVDNDYIQKQVDSFLNQLAVNTFANTQDGVLNAGTEAKIQDVVSQIGKARMHYETTDSQGKVQSYDLSFREIASLRYLFSAGIGVVGQGQVQFDERTESLLVQLQDQFNQETLPSLFNTLFEDLGNFNDPGLQSILDDLGAGPSQMNASGQVDLNGFIQSVIGGFQSGFGELKIGTVTVTGIPVSVNLFGGAVAYGGVQGTMDVKILNRAEAQVLLENGDFSADAMLSVDGSLSVHAKTIMGTKSYGGTEILIMPNKPGLSALSVSIAYESGQESVTSNFVDANAQAKFSMDQSGVLQFSVEGNGTYAIGADLVTVDNFSYHSSIDVGGIFDGLPQDIQQKLNEFAQEQAGMDFIDYFTDKINFGSGWDSNMPGSQGIKGGLYNLFEAVASEYGIQQAWDILDEAFVASGAQDSWNAFKKEIEEEWNKKKNEMDSEWQESVRNEERQMTEKINTSKLLWQAVQVANFNIGDIRGSATAQYTPSGINLATGASVQAGPLSFAASVRLNGVVGKIAEESFADLGPMLAGYNIDASTWNKLVSDANYIVHTTIKDGTFYDNIERIRDAIDDAFSNVNPEVRVSVIAVLINNPQWSNLYRIDIKEFQAKAFGLVSARINLNEGKYQGGLSLEGYQETMDGKNVFTPYLRLSGNASFDKLAVGAAVFFDTRLGFTGAGIDVKLDGGTINIDYQEKILNFKVKMNIETIWKAIDSKKNKMKSPTSMLINLDGAAIVDTEGGELIDYVPFENAQQGWEVMSASTSEQVEMVAGLMAEQDVEALSEELALEENNEQNQAQSSDRPSNVGGIAFDSRTINMQIEGEGLEFDFPDHLITDQMRNLMGLIPEIINFAPVTNPAILIGPLARGEQ